MFKTIASQAGGITEVASFIKEAANTQHQRRELLMTEKAYKLIQQKLTQHIDKKKLRQAIAEALTDKKFNLYSFVDAYV
ncbi:hypothetical protein [Mucilaginibacter sp. SP1R1]|uniref:hypothetical protein n=1 Tax=Mucilaginibacter sp. SP1R1 TaxID=2723091 RepID=UPI003B005CE4